MYKVIVGIDPGAKGAMAVIAGGSLDVYDLKNCITETGTFKSLDPVLFNQLVVKAIPYEYEVEDVVVFCEESLICHGNGIKTARPIFDTRGGIRAVMLQRGYVFKYVAPKDWKRYFGLLKKEKSVSVEKACELFPAHKTLFTKQWREKELLLDGRAEAALIARYGQKTTQLSILKQFNASASNDKVDIICPDCDVEIGQFYHWIKAADHIEHDRCPICHCDAHSEDCNGTYEWCEHCKRSCERREKLEEQREYDAHVDWQIKAMKEWMLA